MDPITLAMLGGTAISSIFGGIQTNKANQTNADIAMLNYYQQQAAQRAAQGEARRQQSEARMGTTDASGNRTYFIPGQGWVTDLTDTQQQLQRGTEQEQLRAVTSGAERAEQLDARSVEDRNAEAIMAEAAMDELRGARPADEGALRQLFLARGAEQRNRQADRTGAAVARQSIRAGGGGDAAELMQRGRGIADQESARTAGVDATLQAQQEGERQFASQRDSASKLYDYFRRSSTTGAQAPQGFSPTGPATRSSGSADQAILQVLQGAPQRDYVAPNLAWTDTINDILGAGQSAYNMNRQAKMDDAILQRWGSNAGSVR